MELREKNELHTNTHHLFWLRCVKTLNTLFIIKWMFRALILLLNKQNLCGIMEITTQIHFSATIHNTCMHTDRHIPSWTNELFNSLCWIHDIFFHFNCIENSLRSILLPQFASHPPPLFTSPHFLFCTLQLSTYLRLLIFVLAHACNLYPT